MVVAGFAALAVAVILVQTVDVLDRGPGGLHALAKKLANQRRATWRRKLQMIAAEDDSEETESVKLLDLEERQRFPVDPGQLAPTCFGNAIRGACRGVWLQPVPARLSGVWAEASDFLSRGVAR